MKIRSLRSRIEVFFGLLIAGVFAVVFVLVGTASQHIARQQNLEDLAVGQRVVERLLADDRAELTESARVVASDFGFRAAVAGNDLGTVRSVLANHGQRIGADAAMLLALDGTLVAHTLAGDRPPRPDAIARLVREARVHGATARVMRLGHAACQVVVVPVLAPRPIAWIALAFRLDDEVARELKALTSLDVTFLSHEHGNQWIALASTQPASMREALARHLAAEPGSGSRASHGIDGFESHIAPLHQDGDSALVVALQRSNDAVAARFYPLRVTLLLLTIISVAIAVLGSVLIAGRITRPINALAALARRVQAGDYGRAAEVPADDEIGALASSFNHMRAAISARESEIRRLAYEDPLTGLPNRAMFNDRLGQAVRIGLREGEGFSVLMLDLDRFKYVNDTLGHEAGDRVLEEVASRFRQILRESDSVARLGGDEFAVLLPSAHREGVVDLVARVHAALREPIEVSGQRVDVGCSIGIASFPEHGADASTLMRRADIAMYASKRSRAGWTVYDPAIEDHRREHLHLLGDLRRAVDGDELELHYQPRMDIATSRIVGVEALLRWRHPQRGLVPPSEFIPFAEPTGTMRAVTRWVVRNSVAQCGDWHARGLPLEVSMNVSARDLLDEDLPWLLAEEIERWRAPPGAVCLEITESALMEDPQRAQSTLEQLRAIGVGLAIDDYGTGYSSLAYLRDLAVTELKIDRVFVKSMIGHRGDSAIVRSTIDLGHSLGLRVVAEGVELDEHLAALRELGCDQAQGYLVARPAPAARIESRLRVAGDRFERPERIELARAAMAP